ncbi:MAG TPA: hypothetical protein VEL76_10080 [Gemmataceae bacterium]|nr:hypothetical protein [Gemmataceae bacterium]
MWYEWLENPCPDLDPNVNAGRIRAFRVCSHEDPQNPKVAVWIQADANQIVKRRFPDPDDPRGEKLKERRRTAPGKAGQWLTEKVWQDPEHGGCLREQEMAARVAKELGKGPLFLPYHRRREHPALGGRKPFVDRIPDSQIRSGRSRVNVYGLADWGKIIAFEKARAEQYPEAPPAGWKDRNGIATLLGLKRPGWALPHVLEQFRQNRPEAALQIRGLTSRGAFRPVWHYDPDAFGDWLGGRTLEELAKPLLASRPMVRPDRLDRLKMFLWFALTRPDYGVGRTALGEKFRQRQFQRFLENPPHGKPLRPCGEVPVDAILRWAREAGLIRKHSAYSEKDGAIQRLPRALYLAKSEAGVKHQLQGEVGRRGGVSTFWYLPGEAFVIPSPAASTTTAGASAGADGAGAEPTTPHPGRGRPASPNSAKVRELCYRRYVKGDKLAAIRAEAERLYGEKAAPKSDSNVATIAKQYARKMGLPLNRPATQSAR